MLGMLHTEHNTFTRAIAVMNRDGIMLIISIDMMAFNSENMALELFLKI